jgi:hypothetical protein
MTLPSTPPLLFEASRPRRLAQGALDIGKDLQIFAQVDS